MNKELIVSEINEIESYYNNVCKDYGVSCKVIEQNSYAFSDEQDIYLVLSAHDIPTGLDIKDIYIRNERSNVLFYPDYHVVKLDDDTKLLSIVDEAVTYCKTVEFLRKIYSEHGLPLPQVIRGDEIGGLKEYNSGRNNAALDPVSRHRFDKHLKRFFKQEKTRSKYLWKWRNFLRSDKYVRKASTFKMFVEFSKRDEPETTVDQLHTTNDDLKTTVINEHEYKRFKEDIKRLFPDVLYAVSDVDVENEGYVKQNKSIGEIKSGPFGKLITYEDFCIEREKRFAAEGYEALKDLNPAYFETRQLTYKEIDEPFVASVLNSIRYAYAKSNALNDVKVPGINTVSVLDVPVDDMMNFVSLAKANKLPFYLDCFGKFSKANFETVRAVYRPENDALVDGIVARMINEKFEFSHINTSLEGNANLDSRIKQASHLQIKSSDREHRQTVEKEL